MKGPLLLVFMVCSCSSQKLYAAPISSCDPAPERISQYQRVHDITIRGLARGPDAIELEMYKVVPALDRLMVWQAGPDTICLSLTAYDRDAHECSVDGIATKDASGEFVFSDGSCVIRFSTGTDNVGMRVLDDGCGKRYCAGKGVMEDAIFVRKR